MHWWEIKSQRIGREKNKRGGKLKGWGTGKGPRAEGGYNGCPGLAVPEGP